MARRTTVAKERARVLPPLERRYAVAVAGVFRGMVKRIEPDLRRVIERRVDPLGTKASPTLVRQIDVELRTIAWDQETRILSTAVKPVSVLIGDEARAAVGRELGIDASFDLNARGLDPIGDQVGARVQQVTDTSRKKVAAMVADGIEKGLSVDQIVKGVPAGTVNVRGPVPAFAGIRGLVDSWASTGTAGFAGRVGTVPLRSSRAYLIALTESGNSFNRAAIRAYEQSGLVDFVEVFDGPDCGWTSHNDPDLAHGSIRTTADAKAHPLAHPRCQRAFGARLDAKTTSPAPLRPAGQAVPGATPGVSAVDPLDRAAVAHSGAGEIPTRQVAEASQRAIERARVAEPAISRSLLETVGGRSVTFEDAMAGKAAAPGGDLAGFAARRKTTTSLSRKIASDMEAAAAKGEPITADQAAAAMGDTVRYTMRFGEGEYTAGTRGAIADLQANGNVLLKAKPTWDSSIYRGLNTNWRAPNGTIFEVQFHTPTSFVTKELIHPLYEEARLLTTSAARRLELEHQMSALTEAVPIPDGALGLTFDSLTIAKKVDQVIESAIGFLDAPEVVAARAELETAKAAYRADRLGFRPDNNSNAAALDDAMTALEKAIIRAREAEIAKARTLPQVLVQQGLADIDAELARIAARKAKLARGAVTREKNLEQAALTHRQYELGKVRAAYTEQLPLEKRILPRPPNVFDDGPGIVYDDSLDLARVLESELGYASRWTGKIQIGGPEAMQAEAFFDWDGTLAVTKVYGLNPANLPGGLAATAQRLKIILHELYHSMSKVTDPAMYLGMRGWEEGVVEMLTQLSERRILTAAGKRVGSSSRVYAKYTEPLEDMRSELARLGFAPALDGERFYLELLKLDSGSAREQWINAAVTSVSDPTWSAKNAKLDDLRRKLTIALAR